MENLNYCHSVIDSIDFVTIDFETATSERSSVCEVGLTIVEDGKIMNTYSWLVKPPNNDYKDFNIRIHGITPEKTINAPGFDQIWKDIYPLINNKVLIAHNAAFDMYALKDVLDLYNLEYPRIIAYCSYRLSKKVFPGLFSYNLAAVSNYLNIALEHHRAGNDAKACAEICLKCFEHGELSSCADIASKYNMIPGLMNPSERNYTGISSVYKPSKRSGSTIKVNARDINGDKSRHKPENMFYEQYVVFTGTLSSMTRKDAMQIIADIGGIPENGITANTNFLVVGQQNFKVVGESGLSGKQKEALKRLQSGQNIEIISEDDFIKNS
jgi:DNA polymerase-3 subunit epsilon